VRTSFCGIELEHPIVNGSGTFDAIAALRTFGDALLERFPFAAFVSKTVTQAPRPGNPPPRLWEAPAGLVNSIGLPNKGLAGYLERDLPALAGLPVPLIVNVMGFTRDEVATLVAAFAERPEVAALELNVSCPNVESGLVMGADPRETAALVERVRPLTAKPLIVKLTPNAADPAAVAWAAQEAGADASRGWRFTPSRGSRGWAVAPAACRVRRCGRSRSRRSPMSRRGWRSRWWEWAVSPAGATPTRCCAPAPPWSRSAPRASGTRSRGSAWCQSCAICGELIARRPLWSPICLQTTDRPGNRALRLLDLNLRSK
jgi:hypothetical protein